MAVSYESVPPGDNSTTPDGARHDDHPATSRPSRGSRFTSWISDTWVLETMAVVLALLCQGGVIGIMIWMNDKPLSRWNIAVSLNATISILSTAAKSFLLLAVAEAISQCKWSHYDRPRRMKDLDAFDYASRGPLGAVQLLSSRSTLANLASLGAIATILSVGMDPFSQQVVAFEERLVPMSAGATASFGISTIYDTGARVNGFSNSDCE